MKKYFALIMMLWFSGIANGLTLSQHYCHGHLAEISVSFIHTSADCGMNSQSNLQSACCHTEQHFFQNEDPAQTYAYSLVEPLLGLESITAVLQWVNVFTSISLIPEQRGPPDQGPPSWIKWGVYLS